MVLKKLIFNSFYFGGGVRLLKNLFLTVSTLRECGVVVLKILIFNSFYFGGVLILKELIFNIFYFVMVWWS